MPGSDREIIERLARIEESIKLQGEMMKEFREDIKEDIHILRVAIDHRIKENGEQNVSIATLDQRLSAVESSVKTRDARIWSAFLMALGALAQAVAKWFVK